jgi:hypothetical protein
MTTMVAVTIAAHIGRPSEPGAGDGMMFRRCLIRAAYMRAPMALSPRGRSRGFPAGGERRWVATPGAGAASTCFQVAAEASARSLQPTEHDARRAIMAVDECHKEPGMRTHRHAQT